MKRLTGFIRDPLVQFVLIGFLIFVFSEQRFSSSPGSLSVIRLAQEEISAIKSDYEKNHGRMPEHDELEQLVNARVIQEVFAREAIRLGMIENDALMTKHLSEKITFIAEALIDQKYLRDESLIQYMKDNEEKYRAPAVIEYEQIYFDTQARGEGARQQVLDALHRIREGITDAAAVTGDRQDELARKSMTLRDSISSIYGENFLDDLLRMKPGQWQGPIMSSKGMHLVKLVRVQHGQLPDIETMRDVLRQDIATLRYFDQVRSRYQIDIDDVDPGT